MKDTKDALKKFEEAKEKAIYKNGKIVNQQEIKDIILLTARNRITQSSGKCRGASDGFGISDCWRTIEHLKRNCRSLSDEAAKVVFLKIMNFCLEDLELAPIEKSVIEENKLTITTFLNS